MAHGACPTLQYSTANLQFMHKVTFITEVLLTQNKLSYAQDWYLKTPLNNSSN